MTEEKFENLRKILKSSNPDDISLGKTLVAEYGPEVPEDKNFNDEHLTWEQFNQLQLDTNILFVKFNKLEPDGYLD